MAYRLTAEAQADLENIFEFSISKFGERQTDAYFQGLEAALHRLMENEALGRSVTGGRLRYRFKSHYIYFMRSDDELLVVGVRHASMGDE